MVRRPRAESGAGEFELPCFHRGGTVVGIATLVRFRKGEENPIELSLLPGTSVPRRFAGRGDRLGGGPLPLVVVKSSTLVSLINQCQLAPNNSAKMRAYKQTK